MASLEYRVVPSGELLRAQDHEVGADALELSFQASSRRARGLMQGAAFPLNRELAQVTAERLQGDPGSAASVRDIEALQKGCPLAGCEPATRTAAPPVQRALPEHAREGGATQPAAGGAPGTRPRRRQWMVPLLLGLVVGTVIVISYTSIPDFPNPLALSAETGAVSPQYSRTHSAYDRATQSKLVELNGKVMVWVKEYTDGFNPAEVTLKRVREDLDLSSDQMLDSWGRPFRYEMNAAGYTLRSSGPDKKLHTADDLVELQPRFPSDRRADSTKHAHR